MVPDDQPSDPAARAEPSPGLEVSLVIPFYNPGPSVLRDTVRRSAEALAACDASFEIVAVSDGSNDGSLEALAEHPPEWLHLVEVVDNRGKGHALRLGFAQAQGGYVGFIDADGDIAPEVLGDFVAVARTDRPEIIFGSKRYPGSRARYSLVRRLYSLGYQRLVRVLFALPAADTQTGIKFLRGDVLGVLLPLLTEERFALDLELFVLARRRGFDRLVELPVHIEKRLGSTVSLRSVRSILVDTLGIFWRLRVRRRH
jgi:glycosyltransferase involved in cell wall biosynthesis